MRLEREQVAELIPHAGAMCLLDAVLDWDAGSIRCLSRRHRAPDNPLRRAGTLGGLCGIEFAAQAMAAHGRLTAPGSERPRAGYLASLRDVVCRVPHLDRLEDELLIIAERLIGDEQQSIYRFALRSGIVEALSGRATVVLAAAP